MQFAIEEQRSIERGEPVRLTPPELRVECVVLRADVYDRMQSELSVVCSRSASPLNSAVGSMSRGQPADPRFKPADRRWNLVGMAVGTALGALPTVIPPPVGPFLTWLSLGAVFGFFAPFIVFLHGHSGNVDQKQFWLLCRIFAAIGCLVGAIIGLAGAPLPEESVVGTCTGGFFAGFAVVELYLRRLDSSRRQDETFWGRLDRE